MGNAPDGILMFGIALGGDDPGWELKSADIDEYGLWEPDWIDREDENFDGVSEALMDRLLAAVGYVEPAEYTPDDWKVKRAARERLGVEITQHGSSEYEACSLITFRTSVEWSDTKMIDFAELEAERVKGDWDAKIMAAIAILGIEPKQEKPSWLLGAHWG